MRWNVEPLTYHKDPGEFFKLLLDYPYPIWLDSCGGRTSGQFDILSCAPTYNLTQGELPPEAFLEKLRNLSNQDPVKVNDFSFTGLMGYFSYEFGVELQGIQPKQSTNHAIPSSWFAWYAWAIVVDHVNQSADLVVKTDSLSPLIDLALIKRYWQEQGLSERPKKELFNLKTPFESNIGYDTYNSALAAIKNHLLKGDTYQVNYTHAFESTYVGDPFQAYLTIRNQNPAEYAAFIRLPEADILSFSPELLVKAKNSEITTKPIKGTAARTYSQSIDYQQVTRLKNCAKNRAENMMIVDLMRSDLSRVAEVDSVQVNNFLDVESLPSVFHLVSTIEARLSKEKDYFDILRAILPGGSITGAPKYRTMKLIEQYEIKSRGVYCGSIGYISADQEMCFNIAIRTLTASMGALSCPAGGGIVLDSVPTEEYQETIDKVAGFINTFYREMYETIDIPPLPAHTVTQ